MINEQTEFRQLLKATDIARMLNISRALAYRLLQTGEIPVIRIRNAVRIQPADLEQYIRRSRDGNSLSFPEQ